MHEKWIALAGLNIAFFLLAAVMDEIAIMVILGPMLIAIGTSFGVDPIHFGAIIVTNVSIGMAAPPIGYCLFIGMAISGLSLAKISRAIWPQILVMLIVLFLTTYIPSFALFAWPGEALHNAAGGSAVDRLRAGPPFLLREDEGREADSARDLRCRRRPGDRFRERSHHAVRSLTTLLVQPQAFHAAGKQDAAGGRGVHPPACSVCGAGSGRPRAP